MRQDYDNTRDPKLQSLVELIQRTTSLNQNQATTLINFAIATYGLEQLGIFPILVFSGTGGTGKTTLLNILEQLSCNPINIGGKLSGPELRDSLNTDTTVLIDEADDMDEKWLIKRYSRQSAQHSVKRSVGDGGWVSEQLNLFGATALHRRLPFKDPAVLSRSIVIPTRKKKSVAPYNAEDFREYAGMLETLTRKVPWEKIQSSTGHRITDTWQPLLLVHQYGLGNEEWLSYAEEQIEKAKDNLELGQEEEPTAAVFQALLFLALEIDLQGNPTRKSQERVLIRDIVKRLQGEGIDLGSWQVGQIARDRSRPIEWCKSTSSC